MRDVMTKRIIHRFVQEEFQGNATTGICNILTGYKMTHWKLALGYTCTPGMLPKVECVLLPIIVLYISLSWYNNVYFSIHCIRVHGKLRHIRWLSQQHQRSWSEQSLFQLPGWWISVVFSRPGNNSDLQNSAPARPIYHSEKEVWHGWETRHDDDMRVFRLRIPYRYMNVVQYFICSKLVSGGTRTGDLPIFRLTS